MTPDRSHERVAELLELALDDPTAAEVCAASLATEHPDEWWRSVAVHMRGLARRQRGDVSGALKELRTAAGLADRSRDPDRAADVRATLGLTLVIRGRTRQGLDQLSRAVTDARAPGTRAKVLMRRGSTLSWVLGRHVEGLADLEQALAAFQSAGDRTWEARTRNYLGLVRLAVGDVKTAQDDLVTARELFLALGQDWEAAATLHNLGLVAFANGDLPAALARYDEVRASRPGGDYASVSLTMDQSQAMLGAGLADEAVAVVQAELDRRTGLPAQRAELQLRLATALLAAGNAAAAQAQARTALASFRRTGRDWFARQAELIVLQARARGARPDRRLVGAARRVAEALELDGSPDAVAGWLLAGGVASRVERAAAPGLLRQAAEHRRDPAALIRASAWLARGYERDLCGDQRGALSACRRGLDSLDLHRETLGSSELRARAMGHGELLARLALDLAAESPPRSLLWWSERCRATALNQPPVRPHGSDPAAGPLAALRDSSRRILVARGQGQDVSQLERERARWEDEVRRVLRRASGTGQVASGSHLQIADLVDAVGDAAFVEIVEVGRAGEQLVALVVHGGRVRRVPLGTTAEAAAAQEFARYTLRRLAAGRRAETGPAGERLQAALLGGAVGLFRSAQEVVVSPPSRLHGVPWGIIPALADLPHSVVPSARLWQQARSRHAASSRRVFVCGPGLAGGGGEIDVVSRRHPDAVVLRGGAASVEQSLEAMDGAGLAHIAAHGRFREDNPLFSALDLADGPLIVHDFERIACPPHRVVLSACDSGVLAPVAAGELLGLASSLLSLGTAGVVASVVGVNDDATAQVMIDLHEGLDRGDDLATALCAARQQAAGDATLAATAGSFLAMGV